jgi:hypothetical protein
MHLYSPERPEASPSNPALLVDGSAVPQITVMPQADGKMLLSCMLRNYNTNESFNYSYHVVELEPAWLPTFFMDYASDPEATIKRHFGWEPQGARPMRTKPNAARATVADAQRYVDSLL